MAFPQVAAVNGGNNIISGTSHTVNLPADISSGDLLLVFFVSDGNPTITFPGNWTQLFQAIHAPASTPKFGCWYRVADGEEDPTITVTTSNDQLTAHTSYRITGYLDVPEVGTPATGSDVNPNPPSLTPSWGAEDTLWFACEGDDYQCTVTGYPTNYTDGRYDRANASGGCCVGTARRELNDTSDDPGTFTISAGVAWVANIVAIRPAEAPVATPYGLVA